jgi:GNAT superfamily N-acetyltransferase
MIEKSVSLRILTPAQALERVSALGDVLIDCVEGGASVGFMAPLTRERAHAYWLSIADGVACGARALLVVETTSDAAAAEVLGTVQLVLQQPENQPHRADVAKMLVRRAARRRGIGAMLMRGAEAAARRNRKTLLVLDTVTGSDASRLYERLGWVRAGEIPGYALWPDGRPCATTYYYKQLL